MITIHSLLKPFTHLDPGYFPEKELRAVIARQQEMQQQLMGVLQEYSQTPRNYAGADGNFLPLVASVLLAQFRDTRVFELLQKIVSRYFHDPQDYEDLIPHVPEAEFSRIWASVCGGNTKTLQTMVMADTLDEELRALALDTVKTCYFEGDIARSDLIAILHALFTQLDSSLEKRRDYLTLWIDWYNTCIDIHPGEMLPLIRKACAAGSIFGSASEFHIEEAEYHASGSLQQWWQETGKEMQRFFGYIKDAVEELSAWKINRQPVESTFDHGEEDAINNTLQEILNIALNKTQPTRRKY